MAETWKDVADGTKLKVVRMYALELTFSQLFWPTAQKQPTLGLQLPLLLTQ
jgi:hypothetical protein